MLSDFLLASMVLAAAMLAIGLLANALPPGHGAIDNDDLGFMVLLAGFVTGLGVLAATYGLSATFVVVAAEASALLSAVVLLGLTIPAAVVALRLASPGDRDGVRASMFLMQGFIGALGALAVILGLSALLLMEGEGVGGFDFLVATAGAVAAGAAIAIGRVGARALREPGGGVVGQPTGDRDSARGRALAIVVVLTIVAVVALGIAYTMFFLTE